MASDAEFRSYVIDGKAQAEHSHQEIEFDYILKGAITCSIAGNPYRMGEGDVILVNSGMLHSWELARGCLVYRVYVSSTLMARVVGRSSVTFWCNSVVSGGKDLDDLRRVLNTMVSEYVTSEGHSSFAFESAKYRFLDLLVKDYMVSGGDFWVDVDDDRVRAALEYVDVHYDSTVTLKTVAKRLYMSEAYLSRLFKDSVGVNFHEYLNRIRLNHAVEELLYTTTPVTQISAQVGFSNSSAFNKVFKKAFSCSPTEYRKAAGELSQKAHEEDEAAALSDGVTRRANDWVASLRAQATAVHSDSERIVLEGASSRTYSCNNFAAIDMDLLSDLLQGPVQRHVLVLHKQLGIEYVRVSNIFERGLKAITSANLYQNYSYVDAAFDFLVENGLKPIVNLTFMRKRIYADFATPLFSDESAEWVPARTIDQWRVLLEGLMLHLLDRYGLHELFSWRFELEYNADYHVFCEESHRLEIPYSELWAATYEVVKGLSARIPLGGDHRLIKADGLPFPDFIAIGELPFRRQEAHGDVYARRTTNLYFLEEAIRNLRRELILSGHAETLILVSTWTTSVSERNAYNDSCGKGAHILMHLINLESENCLLCYHQGSDYLSLFRDTNAPLFGANGLLTRDGIAKPAFFAFLFMRYVHGNVMAKGRDYLALKTESGHFFVVLHNAKDFGHRYFLMRESEITIRSLATIYSDQDNKRFDIKVAVGREGDYRLARIGLSPSEGCVLTEWSNMGSPESLDATMTEYLQHVCRPRVKGTILSSQQGALGFEITLRPHEICLLRIAEVHRNNAN